MSPPAHRPRSPSPVSSTAAICVSASKSSSVAEIRRTISSVRLLSAFGLFRRIRPSDPALSTSTKGSPITSFAVLMFVVLSSLRARSFFADERARNDDTHDFIGAFKNLMNAQVAYNLLDAVFRQIAVATMQLQRFIGNIEADVGDKALGHGAELCCVGSLGIKCGCGPPEEGAGGFEFSRHIG